MVPIDFHKYRQELKTALLAKKKSLAEEWDGFAAAWIGYALSREGVEDNIPLRELSTRLKDWAKENRGLESLRDLGPIAFVCWLQKQLGEPNDSMIVAKLSAKVTTQSADEKLGLLRDPEQVFLLALGLRADEQAKKHLVKVAEDQMNKGPLRRRILFAAALRELGESVEAPAGESQDAGDVIALVWWAERYPGQFKRDVQWKSFANMLETISIEADTNSEFQRMLSVTELALLYEATCLQATQPDPMLLFEYFPLHPRIREISREHFRNAKYVTAVEQACKALNQLIQEKSGVSDKSEAELVQATMKQIADPSKLRIKFNDFLHEDSGKNEQAGLALVCEGVFKAFRNPKGHKPEDHPLVQIGGYEALAQLVTISLVMERVEKAGA